MRGRQSLYDALVPTSLPDKQGEQSRRNALLEERHDKMAHRYYYHAKMKRLRYDDCLMNLSEEFSLGVNQVIACLSKRTELIKSLMHEEINPSDLRKKYPYFNWS